MRRRSWLFALLLVLTLTAGAQDPPGPVNDDPGTGGCTTCPGCVPPYGYTWACEYSCSSNAGECLCRENDIPTSICMKTSTSGGCGCFDNSDDPCCQQRSGF